VAVAHLGLGNGNADRRIVVEGGEVEHCGPRHVVEREHLFGQVVLAEQPQLRRCEFVGELHRHPGIPGCRIGRSSKQVLDSHFVETIDVRATKVAGRSVASS